MIGAVRCHGVGKVFSGSAAPVEALKDVTFELAPNEFLCVVGPSGCGKTTLLRILGGLIAPTSGTVSFSSGGAIRRALVFQDHGLFPWLTVLDNIAFGLEAAGKPRDERRDVAALHAQRVGLDGFLQAYPHQLSGGMQQRVGIARAMAVEPDLLLMDEPFGSLDAQTRLIMQEELLEVWARQRTQVLYVTHDIDEAVRLGDRVLVMTGHPGSISKELPVPLDRPRALSLDSYHEIADLRWEIWSHLEGEVRARMAPRP